MRLCSINCSFYVYFFHHLKLFSVFGEGGSCYLYPCGCINASGKSLHKAYGLKSKNKETNKKTGPMSFASSAVKESSPKETWGGKLTRTHFSRRTKCYIFKMFDLILSTIIESAFSCEGLNPQTKLRVQTCFWRGTNLAPQLSQPLNGGNDGSRFCCGSLCSSVNGTLF